jgi:hypothetical protein
MTLLVLFHIQKCTAFKISWMSSLAWTDGSKLETYITFGQNKFYIILYPELLCILILEIRTN